MNNDVAFIIGNNHRICQDYGRANLDFHRRDSKGKYLPATSLPYVFLSDGCSTGTIHPDFSDTDLGARFLVLAAERFAHTDSLSNVISMAAGMAKMNDLPESCLDATLLSLRMTEWHNKKNALVHANAYGDGVVAGIRRSGNLEIYSLSFQSSYPYYLSYTLSSERTKNLMKATGGSNHLRIVSSLWSPDGNEIFEDRHLKLQDLPPFLKPFPVDGFKVVAVMSDGVHNVMEKQQNGSQWCVPYTDVVRELMTFPPCFTGVFVQRQMQGFLRKAKARGWSFHDDLSLGAIYLGD